MVINHVSVTSWVKLPTPVFGPKKNRQRIHLHSTVETIVPGFGNVLETMTIQKVFNDPCAMLLRLAKGSRLLVATRCLTGHIEKQG